MNDASRKTDVRLTLSRLLGSLLTCSLLCSLSTSAWAWELFERYEPAVRVAEPYIELHTGPGRNFPVFYVAGQGDEIVVLKRRTDWFKVRTPRAKEGWVHIDALSHTLDLDGGPVEVGKLGIDDFHKRRWEVGFNGSDFGGASALSAYLGFAVTPNIGLQLEGTQALGEFSDAVMVTANIVMVPFPQWRVSPYFTIGTGIINTQPHSTIVQAEDREDEIANVGVGASAYLSDRFMLRMEYKRHTVLTSRDDNQEIDQWKAGFSIFF